MTLSVLFGAVGARVDDNRRAFLRLCAAGALAYCSYAMCRSPLLPLFARHLGAPIELIGFIAGASTITGIFVKLPAGALSDVFGRRTLLTTGALVFALLPFAYLTVGALAGLILLRFVHGHATGIFGPVASATLSDLAPPDRRGTWLGTYSAAQGAGQALGPVIAGYLIAAGSFDPAFLVSGAVGMFALVMIAGWRREDPVRHDTFWWKRAAEGIHEVGRDRGLLTTSVAQAGQFFVNGTVSAFLPLYASDALGLTTPQIGFVFGVQTMATLMGRLLFGALSDRFGRRPIIVIGLVTCASGVGAIALVEHFTTLLCSAAVYGLGLAVTTSATSAYVTDLTRRARYGAAHGIFGTIYDVGDAAGPIVAGFLVAATGYREMFGVLSAVSVGLAIAFVLLSRHLSRTV